MLYFQWPSQGYHSLIIRMLILRMIVTAIKCRWSHNPHFPKWHQPETTRLTIIPRNVLTHCPSPVSLEPQPMPLHDHPQGITGKSHLLLTGHDSLLLQCYRVVIVCPDNISNSHLSSPGLVSGVKQCQLFLELASQPFLLLQKPLFVCYGGECPTHSNMLQKCIHKLCSQFLKMTSENFNLLDSLGSWWKFPLGIV